MSHLLDTLAKIPKLLESSDIQQKTIASIVAALVVALLAWLWKTVRVGTSNLVQLALTKWRKPWIRELSKYRETLDDDIFTIRHSWMKEGQTLKDILVPVAVMSDHGRSALEELNVAISTIFTTARITPRIAIIGGPGSGKTVAMRALAHSSWNLPTGGDQAGYFPILFSFSQYRHESFHLRQTVVRSLRSRSFGMVKARNQNDASIEDFVTTQLRLGRLFVLVDGLDELDTNDRTLAFQRIQEDLRQYSTTPICISCRSAAWPGTQRDFQVLHMAPFTDAAIRHFLRNWNFRPPKSAADLVSMIASRPHLADLARSPLMLTIMAFIYSQPRYRLPENRSQFYELCTRALLEEWDQHENPERANRFDRPHKELVLARLAYSHLRGANPDEDIQESEALTILADAMVELGLLKSDNVKMLAEICLNAGLLVRLPPAGLRFPHQTFLEFFATLHLLASKSPQVLLQHYWSDPARWREVLLLYCGLNTDINQTSEILRSLLAKTNGPVNVALVALTEARTVHRDVADDVLSIVESSLTHLGENVVSAVDSATHASSGLARGDLEAASAELSTLLKRQANSLADFKFDSSSDLETRMKDIEEHVSTLASAMLARLRQRRDDYCAEVDQIWSQSGTSLTELIEHLGYFAAHAQSAYANRATIVLRSLLNDAASKRFPKELLEPLLVAVLRSPTDEVVSFVTTHAQELDLRRIVPAMGDSALAMAASVIGESHLTLKKKLEWIDGLRRAGAVRTLYGFLLTAEVEPELQSGMAVALARCSQSKELWECLEQTEGLPVMIVGASNFHDAWGWPFPIPRSEIGQRMLFYLADELCKEMQHRDSGALLALGGDVHPWIAYLALGRAIETNGTLPLPHDTEPAKALRSAGIGVIRSIWKKMASRSWVRWIRWNGGHDAAPLRLAATAPFVISYIWCVAAVLTHSMGWGDAGTQWMPALIYAAFGTAAAVYAFAIYDLDFMFSGFAPSVAVLATCRVFEVRSRGGRASLWLFWMLSFIFMGVFVFWESHAVFRLMICLVPIQWGATMMSFKTLPPLLANSQTSVLCEWLDRSPNVTW